MSDEQIHDRVPHREKHRHLELGFLQERLSTTKIVLVGNPNVGKSLIFHSMSGVYVDVSNFPGTTVQMEKGDYKGFELYDTPGIYGVSSFNDEERVARDIILTSDIILNVVDGMHLERDLFLTQQLIDMGKRVTVLVNFADEIRKNKVLIDYDRLSHFLGVAVIPVSAAEGIEPGTIAEAVRSAREGTQLLG